MLDYLVTSPVRRRLLAVLWAERASGSVTELAQLAHVGFASAHRELLAMKRHDLVTRVKDGRRVVYAANRAHPDADIMERLAVPRPAAPLVSAPGGLRGQLRTLGAPLLDLAVPVAGADREDVLVRGVELARRDPTVARVLPLCFWRSRDALDLVKLHDLARQRGVHHAVGFFLDLTGALSSSPSLRRASRAFRDRRVRGQEFFELPIRTRGRELSRTRASPVARRWSLRMNMPYESFRSSFDKFAHG